MNAYFEGRSSDSPYIEMIWRGYSEEDYTRTCPADCRWNLLFLRKEGNLKVTVEGPTTRAIFKHDDEPTEFLVIKFKLGAFLPFLPVTNLVNTDAQLPEGAGKSFWLNGSTWQLPDFENAETFVNRLVRENVLLIDPVVHGTLQNQPQDFSPRTILRRFLYTTGLTPKELQQIERAKQAANLLGQGGSILDAVAQAGYSDQPHLTRSLRRFYGRTPAQILKASLPE